MTKSLNIHLIARHSLNLICLLFMMFPFYRTYIPLEYDAYWKSNYVWNSEAAIFIFPMIISWVLIQLQLYPKLNKLFNIIIYLLGGSYIFYFSIVFFMPIQDYIPTVGILLTIFVLPVFIIYQITKPKKE